MRYKGGIVGPILGSPISKFNPKPTLNSMITKYITFGQSHRHPKSEIKLRNWVVKVQAPTAELLRKAARTRFGVRYIRFIQDPDETHFPEGVYETLIVKGNNNVHCFPGDKAHELISKDVFVTDEHVSGRVIDLHNPKPQKQEDNEHKKNKKPAGERTQRTEGKAPRPPEQASGSSDQKGSSDEDSESYDYLS